ncbi:class II aldolase/adducin family protein [Arcanobacterium hippocoleae]
MSGEMQEKIIAAGQELLRAGLVARTWGNLSARIDSAHFYCTPSGRNYADLQLAEIVRCGIDGTFAGDVKPTTERSLHAMIYRERPDAQFIIHTHQPYASAMSLGNVPYPVPDNLREMIGSEVLPIANYGLPGQKKLHRAIMMELRESRSRAILMRSHGLLIFGKSAAETIEMALAVEAFCREEYARRASFVPDETERPSVWNRGDGNFPAEVAAIFQKRENINVIFSDHHAAVLSHSPKLVPYLDDFAQLIGIRMTDTPYANAMFGRQEKNSENRGAVYYFGKDFADAEAARMVVQKNALAATMARVLLRRRSACLTEC